MFDPIDDDDTKMSFPFSAVYFIIYMQFTIPNNIF